jgi:hypothetical protein
MSKEKYLQLYPGSKLIDESFREKHIGENNGFYGKTHTEENRKKFSRNAKRQFANGFPLETREKLSKIFTGTKKDSHFKKRTSMGVKLSYIKNKEAILKKREETRLSNGTNDKYGFRCGPDNPMWIVDRSVVKKRGYNSYFKSKRLKHHILYEQKNICPICSKNISTTNADLHHINYDKNDNCRDNLVYLCKSCHAKTNYKRKTWHVKIKKIQSKIING